MLLTTAKVRKLRPGRTRIALSAAAGAAYAAIMFLADIPYLYTFGAKVIVSAIMVWIAFGYGGPLRFIRLFGAFYLVNFATLGGVIGISFLLKQTGSPWGSVTVTEQGGLLLDWQMQLGLLAAAFALSVWLFRSASSSAQSRERLETLLADVTVTIGERSLRCRGLIDTGNRLYDPFTRIPVMVMEASIWSDWLPLGWASRLAAEPADRMVAELGGQTPADADFHDRLRLIPYRGVNGNTRMMLAVKPDAVSVVLGDRLPQTSRRVLIGLDGGRLSSDQTYRAIVHPDLVPAPGSDPAPSQPA